jgi:hypothetical protein
MTTPDENNDIKSKHRAATQRGEQHAAAAMINDGTEWPGDDSGNDGKEPLAGGKDEDQDIVVASIQPRASLRRNEPIQKERAGIARHDVTANERNGPDTLERRRFKKNRNKKQHERSSVAAGTSHQQYSEHASSDEEIEIGAERVGGQDKPRNDPGLYDLEGAMDPLQWYQEYNVEAQVVDEYPTDNAFVGEERERFEAETRERILAELADGAVRAEAVMKDDDETKGTRLFVGCASFILVLIVSIVVGVVVSKARPVEEKSASVIATAAPSPMPTIPLNNTNCDEAQPITVGQSASGSLEDLIPIQIVCRSTEGLSSSNPGWSGRWYVYRGGGFPVAIRLGAEKESVSFGIWLASCQIETGIPLCFSDYYTDNDFDYYAESSGQSNRSTGTILFTDHQEGKKGTIRAKWKAKLDTDYFIFISDRDGDTGDFTLTLETNDSPETAFGPIVPEGGTTTVFGSTMGARIPSDVVPSCGSALEPSGPGVWYMVAGNGGTITASTCGTPTALDTQISVFSLTENRCIDGNDDYCESKSQVAWSTKVDELYFVLVHGKNDEEGTFALQLNVEGDSISDADFCGNAQVVEVGSTTAIDLSGATKDPDFAYCAGNFGDDGIGKFYKFTGTGQNVSTVIDGIAPPFSILAGTSCGSLECIVTECYGCGCEVFPTVVERDYYVYVYSVGGTDQDQYGNLTIEGI